ncbi:MAG: hypothetical protein ACRDIX_01685 [Actinomycetota bacterium]
MKPRLDRRARSAAILAAVALALTVLLSQAALAASPGSSGKSGTEKAGKAPKGSDKHSPGKTDLPPGMGGTPPGKGGTPPGQAAKEPSPSQPGPPSGGSGKSDQPSQPKSRRGPGQGTSPATGSISSQDAGDRSRGTAAPARARSRAVGSPLGGPDWFGSREAHEMTFAAREFTAPVDALIEAGRDMAFPLGLALLVVLFLIFQGAVDRRDPKLAVSPLSQNEILSFE